MGRTDRMPQWQLDHPWYKQPCSSDGRFNHVQVAHYKQCQWCRVDNPYPPEDTDVEIQPSREATRAASVQRVMTPPETASASSSGHTIYATTGSMTMASNARRSAMTRTTPSAPSAGDSFRTRAEPSSVRRAPTVPEQREGPYRVEVSVYEQGLTIEADGSIEYSHPKEVYSQEVLVAATDRYEYYTFVKEMLRSLEHHVYRVPGEYKQTIKNYYRYAAVRRFKGKKDGNRPVFHSEESFNCLTASQVVKNLQHTTGNNYRLQIAIFKDQTEPAAEGSAAASTAASSGESAGSTSQSRPRTSKSRTSDTAARVVPTIKQENAASWSNAIINSSAGMVGVDLTRETRDSTLPPSQPMDQQAIDVAAASSSLATDPTVRETVEPADFGHLSSQLSVRNDDESESTNTAPNEAILSDVQQTANESTASSTQGAKRPRANTVTTLKRSTRNRIKRKL